MATSVSHIGENKILENVCLSSDCWLKIEIFIYTMNTNAVKKKNKTPQQNVN